MKAEARRMKDLKSRLLEPRRWSFKEIFWDRPDIEAMDVDGFKAYIQELRRLGKWEELEFVLRRYVERGNSLEASYFFKPHEILGVIEKIRSSSRAAHFCDPLRVRAWEKAAKRMQRKENGSKEGKGW